MEAKLSLNSGVWQKHITRNAIYSLARCLLDRQIMKGIGHWWWLKPAEVKYINKYPQHYLGDSKARTEGGSKLWNEQLLIKHRNTISLWAAGERLPANHNIPDHWIITWIFITAAQWGPGAADAWGVERDALYFHFKRHSYCMCKERAGVWIAGSVAKMESCAFQTKT